MAPHERVRIALIGTGKRGRNVRLPAIRMMSDRFELAAVCDMNGETVRRVAAECGVPAYTDTGPAIRSCASRRATSATRWSARPTGT